MASARSIRAVFTGAAPMQAPDASGVVLGFRPEGRYPNSDHIDCPAVLGPDPSVAAIAGLGWVVRILRAARIAVPADPMAWLGRETLVLEQLERAEGTALMLKVRPRTRVRFTAWTEEGVETLDDIADVVEAKDAYYVRLQNGRFPVRLPREKVVRHQTESVRWYEVLSIERAPGSR